MADKLAKDVTYAELAVLMAANDGEGALRTGEKLILTFNTVHYLTDGLVAHALDELSASAIATGETEHLILTATSPNTLDKRVQSIEYPNDIIHYDWNPANWMDNINFVTGETPTLISGFKGVITYREDTIQNNSAGFDFRNCKNRLWSIEQAEWSDTPGTYDAGSWVQVTVETPAEGENPATVEYVIYYSLSAAIATDVPSTESSVWRRIFSFSSYSEGNTDLYLSTNSSYGLDICEEYVLPIIDSTDYLDFTVFGNQYNQVKNTHVSKNIVDIEMLLNQ